MPTLFRALCVLLLLPVAVVAQQMPFPLDVPTPAASYLPNIPTHEEAIGHVIGTKHTVPHEVAAYFHAVGEASDRVVVREHGRTYENRPLVHAIVTSPANHARLDAIFERNRQLSLNPGSVSAADLAEMPVVLYQGYSIHGNEATGTEAALLYLYHLAAATGAQIDNALDNAVIIVDPMFNPDGRDRFGDWVNRYRGAVPNADPQDREHNEAWPGGRTNHYWFDLNRDWLPTVHPESKARIGLFYTYRPQVLTDHHEMGSESTFFFQPGIPSRTNPNTPALNQELTGEIAEYHGRLLDDIGSLYYTRESFDDFYYGKGSTYPDINGAIGILFEQASSRALEREISDGVLTYAFGVRNQFVTSLSTLQAGLEMRERLLAMTRDFYGSIPEFAADQDVKAYLIALDDNRTQAQELAGLFQRHQIDVHALGSEVTVDGHTFRPGQAYILPVEQMQGRLLKAVMERVTTFEDSLFYDVSTWTLPYAYDVTFGELTRNPGNLVGAELPAIELDGGNVVGTSNYAYLMRWNRYYAPRALYRLQAAGIAPRLLNAAFEADVAGRREAFPAGTVLIPVAQQGADAATVQRLVREIAASDHVQVYGVSGGMTPVGPELGSRSSQVIAKPKVALLVGDGTSSYDAGEVWHLLGERMHMPVSLLDRDALGRADLSRYTTLVMAGGVFGDVPVDKLKDWVRSGGTLIATESAAGWAVRNGFAELDSKQADTDSLFADLSYAELEAAYGSQQIGGSIFQVNLDPTHPLAYGYDADLKVFHSGTSFYEPSSRPGTNVGTYADDARVSGYISAPMAEVAGGSMAMVGQGMGRGSVVLFAFNPTFRGFWWGTNGLLMNAIFFGDAF